MSDGFTWIAQEPEFVLVNKFPSVNFHTEAGTPGLAVQVSEALGEALWPVHRLDKMTSGLVLFARTAQAAAVFGALFSGRHVEKYYLAIAEGKPKKKQGLIAGDMARSRRKSWKLLASTHNPAVTQFFSCGIGEKRRLYLLKPHTGKTHQLRVALKSMGASIVGDPVYAPGVDASQVIGSRGRGHLHAYCLRFIAFNRQWQFVAQPTGHLFDLPEVQSQLAGPYAVPDALPWPDLPAGLRSPVVGARI